MRIETIEILLAMVDGDIPRFPQAEVRGVLNPFEHASQGGRDLFDLKIVAVPPRGQGLGGIFEAL